MLHTSRKYARQTQKRRILQAWIVIIITEWFGQGKGQIKNVTEMIL